MRTMLAVTVMLVSSSALAWGPVVEAGGLVAGTAADGSSSQAVDFRTFSGLSASAGVEFGDRFNHEISLEWARLADVTPKLALAETTALRYVFSVDFLGKTGFTPTLGVGVSLGRFTAASPGDQVAGLYVAGRVVGGFRYSFGFGLSVKVDVTGQLYGNGHFGVLPSVGLAFRF